MNYVGLIDFTISFRLYFKLMHQLTVLSGSVTIPNTYMA